MTLSVVLKTAVETNDILIRYGGGVSQFFTILTNGSDIFLTAAVTFQSETNTDDVDLVASGERVDGIVVSEAFPFKIDFDKSSDDPFDDNSWIRCYRPIRGDLLYATAATATTIAKDDWVKYSGGFLTGATNKDDAIGRLANGGVAVTGASGVEQICSIEWGAT